jgi:hypothetical protein
VAKPIARAIIASEGMWWEDTMHHLRRTLILVPFLTLFADPAGVRAVSPLEVNVAEIMTVIGNWIGGYVKYQDEQKRELIKKSVPTLATKLAGIAGQKRSLAAALEEPIEVPYGTRQLNAQLQELNTAVKGLVEFLKSIDPEFGIKHPQLISKLNETIDGKARLIQQAANDGANLGDSATRLQVANLLRTEATAIDKLAQDLSAAYIGK